MKGSECQDNSKNNVAAVYFESSLTMHNPLFFVHKSGLSLRAGCRGFSLATRSVSHGYFQRKQKKNRARRTFWLYNSPPTNRICPATCRFVSLEFSVFVCVS